MNYWESRSHLNYYAKVKGILESLGPMHSILDVGCADTPVVTWGDFQCRCSVDRKPQEPLDGVWRITAPWPDVAETLFREQSVSVVTCLQVLEHVTDPKAFAAALFMVARERVIISVPYMWPVKDGSGHIHDPVDETKSASWCGRWPTRVYKILDNHSERLVAEYA